MNKHFIYTVQQSSFLFPYAVRARIQICSLFYTVSIFKILSYLEMAHLTQVQGVYLWNHWLPSYLNIYLYT
jgi:hypothetical protein